MNDDVTAPSTTDTTGAAVVVGTRVRVLAIRASVLAPLDEQERARVQSMLGEVFAVYEVDPWGQAWVEKWWQESEDTCASHSLALEPGEMEIFKGPV